MFGRSLKGSVLWATIAFAAALASAGVPDPDKERVKREEVFEFARKPVVTRSGDRVTIAFETKGFCDVTVAIEDEAGRIVRFLASGVLGPNAPKPFQKNSKKQVIVWDSKDEQDAYVTDPDRLTVRVSLGLKARLERILFWEPKKRVSYAPSLMVAAEEGMYVYDGDVVDHLRLFDHQGNYVRTVHPFPRSKLREVKGLDWQYFDRAGDTLPVKRAARWTTFLTSGENGKPWYQDKSEVGLKAGSAASAMAIRGNRIALVKLFLNRLATDGTTGGLPLTGPRTSITNSVWINEQRDWELFPSSAALSPDGAWLYLTRYVYPDPLTGTTASYFLHGVHRMRLAGDEEPQAFVGSMDKDKHGSGHGQFKDPTSVDCDSKGRVYVTDYINDRVEVFSPEGEFLKSIPVKRPGLIRIHRRTDELFVFTWVVRSRFVSKHKFDGEEARRLYTSPTLTRIRSFEDPTVVGQYPIPFHLDRWRLLCRVDPLYTQHYTAEIDSWTDPPTVWLSEARRYGWGIGMDMKPWRQMGIRIATFEGDKLVVKQDFGEETVASILKVDRERRFAQYPIANPKTGRLYLFEQFMLDGSHSPLDLLEIDPATGKSRIVILPFTPTDVAFGPDGLLYATCEDTIVRYDMEARREVPWDYGEERVGFRSVLHLPQGGIAPKHHRFLNMAVSPRGHVAVCDSAEVDGRKTHPHGWLRWTPTLYRGRSGGTIHVWDQYGKFLHKDAVPGVGAGNGFGLDRNGDIAAMTRVYRLVDGKAVFFGRTGTLMKVKPGVTRVLSASTEIPAPLPKEERPKRPFDFGEAWVEGAYWMYGGAGFSPAGIGCPCWHSQFSLDYFGRSFVPEPYLYRVTVLDTNGNIVLHVGRYGNEDDGMPLVAAGGPPHPRSIGGDEVGLFTGQYVGVHTDRRLFIADAGNARILSVRLDYHVTEEVALKSVTDGAP